MSNLRCQLRWDIRLHSSNPVLKEIWRAPDQKSLMNIMDLGLPVGLPGIVPLNIPDVTIFMLKRFFIEETKRHG